MSSRQLRFWSLLIVVRGSIHYGRIVSYCSHQSVQKDGCGRFYDANIVHFIQRVTGECGIAAARYVITTHYTILEPELLVASLVWLTAIGVESFTTDSLTKVKLSSRKQTGNEMKTIPCRLGARCGGWSADIILYKLRVHPEVQVSIDLYFAKTVDLAGSNVRSSISETFRHNKSGHLSPEPARIIKGISRDATDPSSSSIEFLSAKSIQVGTLMFSRHPWTHRPTLSKRDVTHSHQN
ncbi:hypothetical protein J6590_019489 [Homalodisca vitripennis]|nr:hypothetical protein J6590_019489 [Homalodisca vitripennis]